MENKQLLPFERNRYYAGKMLTSADFQAEQTYFNNKRRFLNSVMYGCGIVCGYSVYSLDDQSVLIESGVAFDSWGREIVIEKSIVKKLSAVEGFEQLKSDEAVLCLRYAEEKVHPVYAVGRLDREEPEFNRISEGFDIFLMDAADAENDRRTVMEFFAEGQLFSCDDYIVSFQMPAAVCKGRPVKMVIRAEKISARNSQLSFGCILQMPAFLNRQGGHEISVDFDGIRLRQGESAIREFWLDTMPVASDETDIVLKAGSAAARLDGQYIEMTEAFSVKIMLTDIPPRYLVAREIGKLSLEMRDMGEQEPWVRLADIRLTRTENSFLIEEITEERNKRYIQTPADEMLRSEFMEYFGKAEENGKQNTEEKLNLSAESMQPSGRAGGLEIAAGVLEIPLGDHVRRGDIRYSGEIMHGLGKGNVYVEVGYECIARDRVEGANVKSTIYGNPSLFQNDNESLSNVETAVKVLNDKGSFVVAAKLARDVDFLMLTYQWVAVKFPSGNVAGDAGELQNKSIQAETPTVVLRAKESYYFGVRFTNMENCSIAYELSESGSGEITSDGVYTAPNKEGVYEIRIYCTDNPIICTYAYAIVKKDNEDEKTEADAGQ